MVARRPRQHAVNTEGSALPTMLRSPHARILAAVLFASLSITGCASNIESVSHPSSEVSANNQSELPEPIGESPELVVIPETANPGASNTITGLETVPNLNTNPTDEGTNNLGLHTVTRVVDGDTVYVDGFDERVRLIGIDTPERDECGFAEATSRITELVTGQPVTLLSNPGNEVDTWGRPLVFIEVKGVDVGGQLIAEGLAIPRFNSTDGFSEHPREEYYFQLAAAAPATCANSGIVETTSPEPANTPNPDTDGECLIKGNISRTGEKIFHVPGQQNYDETVINESAGERWFCTAEEAIAAGWRAARR